MHIELRVCPKCRGTFLDAAFKRRSRAQRCTPSWCRSCINRQDRDRRARRRQREANELLRRIRFGTPPTKVEALFGGAARRVGGVEVLALQLATQIKGHDARIAFGAAKMFMKLVVACDACQKR